MADLFEVEQAVADRVSSILYPAGPIQSSIVGTLCRVYRGWPNSGTLNTDLSAGIANVTVSSENDSGRTTTRYLPKWQTTSRVPGVSASVSGQTITISGYPVLGDVVGALIDALPFAYRIQPGDTPSLIAANLNQLIQATRISNLQGNNIFVPSARSVKARVVCDAAASYESRRQEKDVRIICWCPTPPIRDQIAAAIDTAMNTVDFLTLPDATDARMIYRSTASYDQAQNALLYRRDLIYTTEYPTFSTVIQPSMLFGISDLNSNSTYG